MASCTLHPRASKDSGRRKDYSLSSLHHREGTQPYVGTLCSIFSLPQDFLHTEQIHQVKTCANRKLAVSLAEEEYERHMKTSSLAPKSPATLGAGWADIRAQNGKTRAAEPCRVKSNAQGQGTGKRKHWSPHWNVRAKSIQDLGQVQDK